MAKKEKHVFTVELETPVWQRFQKIIEKERFVVGSRGVLELIDQAVEAGTIKQLTLKTQRSEPC